MRCLKAAFSLGWNVPMLVATTACGRCCGAATAAASTATAADQGAGAAHESRGESGRRAGELVQPQVADDATNGRRIFGIFLFNRSALEAPVKSTRWGRQPPPAPIPWPSRPRPPVRTQRTRIERTKAHIFTRRQHADPTVRGQHAQRSHGQHCMRRASAACVPAADSSAHAPSARPSTSPFPLAVPRLRRQ